MHGLTRCWLLQVHPNVPDECPTPVGVFTDHEVALRELNRLQAATEPLRDLTDSFRESIEQYGGRWYDHPPLLAQQRVLRARLDAFRQQEGFEFEPDYYMHRYHSWQPTLRLTELPLDAAGGAT